VDDRRIAEYWRDGMKRKLDWRNDKGFEGWTCSNCGWLYPDLRLQVDKKEHSKIIRGKFDAHIYARYPKNRES
jgi:hypothetical protein